MNFLLCIIAGLIILTSMIAPTIIYTIYDHTYYLVNPTLEELRSVQNLNDSKFIRTVLLSEEPIYISVDNETFCLIEYVTMSRGFDGEEARDYMDDQNINYFRKKDEALESIGHSPADNLYKQCEKR